MVGGRVVGGRVVGGRVGGGVNPPPQTTPLLPQSQPQQFLFMQLTPLLYLTIARPWHVGQLWALLVTGQRLHTLLEQNCPRARPGPIVRPVTRTAAQTTWP